MIFFRFVEFFYHLLTNMLSTCGENNVSLNLFLKVRDEVQNVFVKSFQSRNGLTDQCKMKKTNSIKRKTGAERPETARADQNYKYVSEIICRQEGNTGSSRSPREMRNLTAISLSSGCCEKLSWTQTRHRQCILPLCQNASGVFRLYRNIFV